MRSTERNPATTAQSRYGTLPLPSARPTIRLSKSVLVVLAGFMAVTCLGFHFLLSGPSFGAPLSPRMRLDAVAPELMLVEPRQLHLAFAGTSPGTGMTVSWTTYRKVNDSCVWYGVTADDLSLEVQAEPRSYYADDNYTLFTYHATLDSLTPLTQYYYRVGSRANQTLRSAVHRFKTGRPTLPVHANDTFEAAIYADFGERNAEATVRLLTQFKDRVEFIWHVGDISYADNAFHALNADTAALGFVYEKAYNAWMDALEPTMQEVPYMTTVGNHEAECYSPVCIYSREKQAQLSNYSAYNARFRMPSNGALNMWYSWNHGPVHFVSISSETDYDGAPSNNKGTSVENGHFGDQLSWLETDLGRVNRSETPWVIVGCHRPVYGLKVYKANGKPKAKQQALQKAFEPHFLRHKVDVVISGHQHAYERHFPIAESKPHLEGVSLDRSRYRSPTAPVYIVSGSCGSTDGHEPYVDVAAQTWNVLYDNVHYGISTLRANRTALEWAFVHSVDGATIDHFTIVNE
ncbi:unnamed protein product [Aphanomyces euteiches]